MPSSLRSSCPNARGRGARRACASLIDRLDQLVRDSGIAPRLRDHGIGIAEAPTLAREAMKQTRLLVNNPCAIDGGGRAAAVRGRLVSRQPPAARADFKVWRKDHDALGGQ